MTPHRFVPHTADVAVELEAPDFTGLRQAGIDALRELLVGEAEVRPDVERPIPLRGADDAERLIHFLADALYLFETERFVPARVSTAGVSGEPFDPARHESRPEVKAVTHHGVGVRRDGAGLRATIVFDV